MTDTEKKEMQDMLASLLPKLQDVQPSAPSVWGKPQTTPTDPESVSVPISLQTNSGRVRLYLNFSNVTTPDQILALVQGLIDKNVPVDCWKQEQWGGGNKWKRN
jgi:hypothetical protein